MSSDHPSDERVASDGRIESAPLTDGVSRRRRRVFSGEDVPLLGAVLLVGALMYVTYLATHDYPAYGAGLYLEIADQIRTHGYVLPEQIPGYTKGGIPFAYPPLMFYVAAVLRDLTGIGPIAYARYVPGVLVLLYLIPYYFVARELLASSRRAAIASVLFAVTPAALQWHLSAGGIVRAMGLLLVLTGTYVGLRLFRGGDRRWLVPGVVCFGLTVLTHPTYTVVFGLTYLLLFVSFDRSITGLVAGAAVASGGLLLAAPWWLEVIQHHGVGIFTAAAGTHSGLGGGVGRVLSEFVYLMDFDTEALYYVAAYAGTGYALYRRQWFLPAWLFSLGYVVGKPRFQFLAGSMLTAVLLVEVVVPRIRRAGLPLDRRRTVSLFVAGVLVLGAVGLGTAFVASASNSHDGSTTMPAFMDGSDEKAMAWAQRNTAPSSSFVVLGDAAEWFPLLTDRTILVGPWGVEWTTPERYQSQLELYESISECEGAPCLTAKLQAYGHSPDYVYVPKGHYTVRGMDHTQSDRMRDSLQAADRYEIAYENEGVVIVRVSDS
ncbi:glycosyltransferase family 39 protein [Haloarcula sp. JP-L23]|uniref:glycosyltransferase family 39 protein n=1 Tax=Haloarcula sp. JP-L23 TaxID=2716717 RepID=UPI00140EE0A2|nr:hypothetical protein G9465_19815 [Haloarcula sp. JP-L23]